MEKHSFIFIGRSGCGKGTQVKLLMEHLKEIDPGREIFHLESGAKFRELFKKDTYTARLARKINDEGGLQPAFLSIYVWSDLLVENLEEDEHLMLDGVPRREEEAISLVKALKYYGYPQNHTVFLDVSESWARERLKERGREDDADRSDVDSKMKWFEEKVVPTINYMKGHGDDFIFHQINGEETIEEVHKEIVAKLNL